MIGNQIMKASIIFGILFSVFFIHGRVSAQQDKIPDFYEVVQKRFGNVNSQSSQGENTKNANFDFQKVCPTKTSFVARKVFEEYGAIFMAENVVYSDGCILSETSADYFQTTAGQQTESIDGIVITLQVSAMKAFLKAREEAAKVRLSISPRGKTASKRSYQQTVALWNSRFFPALNYWVRRKRISASQAKEVRMMPLYQQVEQVLLWEEEGIYFSKDLSKSILYSVAVPGASQHIFMLALDVQQFSNPKVRKILADNGWFQTVKSDAPHFTYLGVPNDAEKLKALGLKSEKVGEQEFWVPNLN